MTHSSQKPEWYNVEIVVEILIHEMPNGEKYAPYIGNLCIGFTSLTLEKLGEEIDDIRKVWPQVFPKSLSTLDLLSVIRKKYKAYEEIMALRHV